MGEWMSVMHVKINDCVALFVSSSLEKTILYITILGNETIQNEGENIFRTERWRGYQLVNVDEFIGLPLFPNWRLFIG